MTAAPLEWHAMSVDVMLFKIAGHLLAFYGAVLKKIGSLLRNGGVKGNLVPVR
ncbi:MAG: hypothetical protein PHY45_01225 [Rhodocyclaceae bacterium]|nr:hypothetical protein [Rhodocyclaceae bacterium]